MISLEYIAGFFDGEGSVGVYQASRKQRANTNYYLRTQLCQNVSPLAVTMFDELVERFGGSASRQVTRTHVKLNWQLNSEKAIDFLKAIQPHLIMKAPQVEAVMGWWEARPKVGERHATGTYVRIDHPGDAILSETLRAMKRVAA